MRQGRGERTEGASAWRFFARRFRSGRQHPSHLSGSPARLRAGARGFTLAELVMVCALLAILAAIVYPSARFMIKREREAELRLDLRLMRNAIDEHKRLADQGMIQVDLGTEGYPKELEDLVEGVSIVGQKDKRKFLRRIPVDPMTGKAEWGLRSYQDEPESTSWGGQNVYDVYSLSEATALDGTKYKDW